MIIFSRMMNVFVMRGMHIKKIHTKTCRTSLSKISQFDQFLDKLGRQSAQEQNITALTTFNHKKNGKFRENGVDYPNL